MGFDIGDVEIEIALDDVSIIKNMFQIIRQEWRSWSETSFGKSSAANGS